MKKFVVTENEIAELVTVQSAIGLIGAVVADLPRESLGVDFSPFLGEFNRLQDSINTAGTKFMEDRKLPEPAAS